LLRPAESINLLENLQVARTTEALHAITKPKEFIQPLRKAFFTLVFSVLICIGLYAIPFYSTKVEMSLPIPSSNINQLEKILPGITSIQLKITPPIYTKSQPYMQQQFNVQAPEGSALTWLLQTSVAATSLKFVFNDSSVINLKPVNKEHTAWDAQKQATNSGFYQLVLDGNISEFYKIEVVKDQPPVIAVQSPVPTTTIEFWEPHRITVNASVSDDYGIKNAEIIATTASGGGEAVKFKEQKIGFGNSFSGEAKQYQLQRMVDLDALAMQPGDELYLYIQAEDNNHHLKKSDILIISLADTAQLSQAEGLVNGENIKPEYFRSERQIIIETEQLLKDKDTISITDFNNRSNNLGIDQKLLRLRYGKFLGEEEEESEGGVDKSKNDVLSDPTNFGNAGIVLDAFTDKHDNAEDASFFDVGTKTLLKNTLTEMWNTEARLRTFKPKDALPYAYKALKLLKSLQEQSRVYVAKTTFKTTQLKPEKRLTGELDKIVQPVEQSVTDKNNGTNEIAANALGKLEELKANNGAINNVQVLEQSLQLLAAKAAVEPSGYLKGLQAMKEILSAVQNNKKTLAHDINSAEAALQKLANEPAQLPQKGNGDVYDVLQQQYFNNLHKNNKQ
jgi:hypothetical protein